MFAATHENTITGWTELESELEAWLACGFPATFWWRDDDATQAGPQLDRLLAIAGTVPVSLAVIPAQATAELSERLSTQATVTVLQHGHAHTNHAPAESKKVEFGDTRPMATMLPEIARGRERMATLFDDRFLPVFVPPWNRFAAALPSELRRKGFAGISAYGPRDRHADIRTTNCHADIIDWRGNRSFVGEDALLQSVVAHLSARRNGAVDRLEPTGLLTHHRDHDNDCWRFIEQFARFIEGHPGAAWTSSVSEFPSAPQ